MKTTLRFSWAGRRGEGSSAGTAMASGGDGGARGREGGGARGGDEHGESERASRGPRGVSRGSRKRAGRQEEVEAGGGRGSAVRAPRTMPEGMGKTTREEVGWAGQPGRPGGLWWVPAKFQVSLSLSFISCFLFFCNFVAFLKILRHFQKSPNCTCPLFRTYPTWNISVWDYLDV